MLKHYNLLKLPISQWYPSSDCFPFSVRSALHCRSHFPRAKSKFEGPIPCVFYKVRRTIIHKYPTVTAGGALCDATLCFTRRSMSCSQSCQCQKKIDSYLVTSRLKLPYLWFCVFGRLHFRLGAEAVYHIRNLLALALQEDFILLLQIFRINKKIDKSL